MRTLDKDTDIAEELLSKANLNDALRTAEIQNEFLLVPEDVSQLRDLVVTNTGNESVTFTGGEYEISTTANGSDDISFETVEIGRYRAGLVAVHGIYARKESTPEGVAEWGYGGDGFNNGIYIRYKSDGSLSFVIEKNNIETEIDESFWDINTVEKEITNENGNVSGLVWGFGNHQDIDVADGYIYRTDWTWYGGGLIVQNVIEVNDKGEQRSTPLVAYKPTGRISIEEPNMPLFARLSNEGTATSDTLHIAGRQFSVIGESKDENRVTEHYNTDITVSDTNYTELVAFRRRSDKRGVELGLRGIDIQTDQQLHYKTLVSPSQTSANWATPIGNKSNEVAIEVADTPDFDTTTGVKYRGGIVGSGKNSLSLNTVDTTSFPIPRHEPVVIAAKSLTGNNATVDFSLKVNETW